MHEDREKCMRAGMDAFVSKPMRIQDLKAVLDQCRSHEVELEVQEAI